MSLGVSAFVACFCMGRFVNANIALSFQSDSAGDTEMRPILSNQDSQALDILQQSGSDHPNLATNRRYCRGGFVHDGDILSLVMVGMFARGGEERQREE